MKYALIGPTYPYRGGLAHFTTLLVRRLREQHTVTFYSYKRQYPAWLFPGNIDPDPSLITMRVDAEMIIDALNPLTYWRVARAIVADKPDALILQWWTPYWLPLHALVAAAAHRAGIPVIYLCHQLVEPDSSPAEWQIARLGLAQGDAFIMLTQREHAIVQLAFPGRPTRVAPLPVFDQFPDASQTPTQARLQLGLPIDVPLLLCFGFVRRYKGINYLLEALAQIERNVYLVIAGEFWEPEQEYRAQLDRLGLADRVLLHNRYVPNEDVAAYFTAADALVLPYVSGSQSGVAMIAVHYGLPVIATNVGGLSETIVDGQNGLIVPPADSGQLARAIARFFDENVADSMRAAMQQSQQRLSWAALTSMIEELTHE
ncbi:MAG: glycosyltransferase, partial [Roseiflexaceae bacterium]|nr:glycosyltransferase [Roseiflexaceae bacterium]